MTISRLLKEKVIIIADANPSLVVEILTFLKENGFKRIKIAKDGEKVEQLLMPYDDNPDKIGLVVMGQNLPLCDVQNMSTTLADAQSDKGLVIPFIILRTESESHKKSVVESEHGFYEQSLIRVVDCPIHYDEFLRAINFQLSVNYERCLRYKQEGRLVSELEERKAVDARLKHLIVHDELTSLLNRQNFEERLRLILKRNKRLNQWGALLFIDIDLFSLINEMDGFDVGDRLLIDIVTIIQKKIKSSHLFARIGSDEFCLFLEDKDALDVKKFSEDIRGEIFDSRFFIGEICYTASVSIGIVTQQLNKAISHPGEMIMRARQACRVAKRNGRNMVEEYSEVHKSSQERNNDIYWVPLIRKALVEGRFFLMYQPIVDLKTGRVSHYEALVRMKGLDNEDISPMEFIPVAERIGLIQRIDFWVIEKGIDFLASLPPSQSKVSLSINLSSEVFQDGSLLPVIKDKLDLGWIDAGRITFEITERNIVERLEKTQELVEQIKALGCKFALDDFGTGFCSFNYLRFLPVDYLKIDGQFIRNITHDETDRILVKSMVDIAKKMGKKTIAEYVETPEILAKLREMGVDFGQGYLFGKPKNKVLPKAIISLDELTRTQKVILLGSDAKVPIVDKKISS
ncbi:MAG: bifunctional diguanylate cyclase/phosphodiesterase [Methylococcales bacterium]|nr:bifunctional diguanylate cyclase/phosphodiesterase [Methylococcales bacterium]